MANVKNDNWIRKFDVTSPKRHKNGFTVYKVTSVVFPRCAPEASTKVVVWKRYNDFKKLYKTLKNYHQPLNVNEDLPKLCKDKFFKRFDECIIKDRIRFALDLLNFIGRHQSLFTSDPLLQFFNSGYQISDDTLDIFDNESNLDLSNNLPKQVDMKRNGLTEKLLDTKSSNESVSVLCEYSDEDSVLSLDSFEAISPVHSITSDISTVITLNDVGRLISPKEKRTADLGGTSPTRAGETDGNSVDSTVHVAVPESPAESQLALSRTCSSTDTAECLSGSDSWLVLSPRTGDLVLPSLGGFSDGQDYLIDAAYHVGQGQKYEIEEEYEAAVHHYKEAVGCLRSGLQTEKEKRMRVAVEQKACQYLRRAEKIYEAHLAASARRAEPRRVSNAVNELKMYKVLKVLDSVMLVLNAEDDRYYIIKVLEKSPCPVDAKKKDRIPYNVPYMVKLYKYFENENSIFLVLEYAKRGKLWDQLCGLSDFTFSHTEWQTRESACWKTDHQAAGNRMKESFEGIRLMWDESDGSDRLGPCPKIEVSGVEAAGDGKEEDKTDGADRIEVKGSFPFDTNGNCSSSSRDGLDLEVSNLLENSQKLLNSVSKTLQTSEELTNSLNKDLLNIETIFDFNSRLATVEKFGSNFPDVQNRKKRSRSAIVKSKLEKSHSSEDLTDSRPRTASNSVDRRTDWRRMTGTTEFSPRLSESVIRNWAAEILVALETLHKYGIICRDLRPGNILLGDEGSVLLTFQADWKGVDSPISEEAISGFYAAPENLSVFPITPAVDWWSYGVLLYELLTGQTFSSCYPEGILGHTILTFPDFLSPEACSLLGQLLKYNPGERLGSSVNGAEDIKCHPFFNLVDWQSLYSNY